MLQYLVVEKNNHNDIIIIKGIYSSPEPARNLMKILYKNNNKYFNRDTTEDNILNNKILAIDINKANNKRSISIGYSIEELQFEMDRECDIKIG